MSNVSDLFRPMADVQTRLRALFFGASGAGKTTSALGIALGLCSDASRVCLLDSERGSAAKAGRDLGQPFIHADVEPFSRLVPGGTKPRLVKNDPRTYEAAIKAAAENYDVVVVDSLTHAWEACRELVDVVAADVFRNNSHKAWSKVTPLWRSLLDTILTAPAHVIVTARAKVLWEDQKRGSKTVPVAVGYQPELRAGVEYEFDVVAHIDAEHVAHVMKARSREFDGQSVPLPGPDFGKALGAWLAGGEDPMEWATRELQGMSLTVEATDKYLAGLGKSPVAKLTPLEQRKLVSWLAANEAKRAEVQQFVEAA